MERTEKTISSYNNFFSGAASFLAALMLTLSLVTFSVLILLSSTGLFERALFQNVKWESMGIPEADIKSFAAATIGFLRGDVPNWQPVLHTTEGILPIAENFTSHMETVKHGVWSAFRLALCLAIPAVLLLMISFFLLPGGFSRKAYLAGVLAPLVMTFVVCCIAAVDFQSLWFWLHQHFIPDGIFSAGEPIMRMFPLSLFFSYLIPLLLLLAAAVVILLLPLILSRKKAAHT